jgi:PAS domain S-box-containing protein
LAIKVERANKQVSSQQPVHERLAALSPIFALAAIGDFSKDVPIPEREDEFTEVYVGVQMMLNVIREQLGEMNQTNQSLVLRAAERNVALKEAQALTHLGSWQWDILDQKITWSDEMYRIYGFVPNSIDVTLESYMSLIHPDDVTRVKKLIKDALKNPAPLDFDHRINLPDGTERVLHCNGKVITDVDNTPLVMMGTAQDVTDIKNTELALKESNDRFEFVTQATSDVLYDLDLQSGTLWFNDALYTEYGYPKDEPSTSVAWWAEHMHPQDAMRVNDELSELQNNREKLWTSEYRFLKNDGTYAAVKDRAFVLRGESGEPIRLIGSMLDITQQKELERVKDEFISLVSHQLRTPLTSVRLFTEMLSAGQVGKLTELQQDYVDKVEVSTIRMIQMVSDILNISRVELGRLKILPKPADMTKLIQRHIEEVAPLAVKKDLQIIFKPAKEAGEVNVDTTLFGQIVQNLLSNAIRYTPAEGKPITVSFDKQKTGYILKVSDKGIGIPESMQSRIFERFYRADNAIKTVGDGSGLGLYLVKVIIEEAGGKVWFKSQEGKGTTFYVRLPKNGMQPIIGNKR